MIIPLLLLFIPSALADIKGEQFSFDSSACRGSIYSLGMGEELKFDSASLHFSLTKQFSPADPSLPNGGLKHTDNWTGGLDQNLSDGFSIGLDHDHLADLVEHLYTDGAKISASSDIFHLSYRLARNKIDQDFVTLPRVKGAFVYQTTVEGSVDLVIGEKDKLSPSLTYSFFKPDIHHFSDLLSQNFSSELSNFSDTLLSFKQWGCGLNYDHEFNKDYSAGVNLTYAHLIIGKNPSMGLNPSLTQKFNSTFLGQVGIDYAYIPGTPTVAITLGIKVNSGKEKDEKPGDDDEDDGE